MIGLNSCGALPVSDVSKGKKRFTVTVPAAKVKGQVSVPIKQENKKSNLVYAYYKKTNSRSKGKKRFTVTVPAAKVNGTRSFLILYTNPYIT